MAGIFSKPSYDVQAPPPAPTGMSDEEKAALKSAEEERQRQARGRASTLVTSPGTTLSEPTVTKKTLLGQ